MASASNYTEKNVLNAMLRGVPFPLPAKTYVSLHTADPTDVGGNEVSIADWPAYVRREAEQGGAIGTGWTEPDDDGICTNTNQLTYPSNDGINTITVTHFAIYDAITGGNMLTHAAFDTPRELDPTDIVVLDINTLSVELA